MCLSFALRSCAFNSGIKTFKALMVGVAQTVHHLCHFDVIETWTGQSSLTPIHRIYSSGLWQL